VTHTWTDVPDPRDEACPGGALCEITLLEDRWSHIHPHVCNPDEPWDDWLTPALARDFRDSTQPHVTGTQQQVTRKQVSDRMEQAARESTDLPFAVLYDVAQPVGGARRSSSWMLTIDLVLSCGAKLCLRDYEDKGLNVLTCSFPTGARSAAPGRRWKVLARQLTLRYARDNGDGTFSPPERSAWPIGNEKRELIDNPRFRTDSTWGLDGKKVDPWDHLPHFSPPPMAPGPPTPPMGPRHDY